MINQSYQSQQLVYTSHNPIGTQQSLNYKASSNLPQSSHELNKVIKSLQKLYTEQKLKRKSLEDQIMQVKKRAITRQGQLLGVVKRLKEKEGTVAKESPEIVNLFNKIWGSFDTYKEKTAQILEQKCEDNFSTMNRKIVNIMDCMNQQLGRNAKISNQDLMSIKTDLKQVCQIAIKIEQKNIQMARIVKQVQFQLKVLNEQKFLILQDLIQKKNYLNKALQQNKTLASQIQKLKQISKKQNKDSQQQIKNKPSNHIAQTKVPRMRQIRKFQTVSSHREIQQQARKSISRLSQKRPYSRHLTKNRSQLYQSILSNPQQFNYSKLEVDPKNFNPQVYNTFFTSKRNKLIQKKKQLGLNLSNLNQHDNILSASDLQNDKKSLISVRRKIQNKNMQVINSMQQYNNQYKIMLNKQKRMHSRDQASLNKKQSSIHSTLENNFEQQNKRLKLKQINYNNTISNLQRNLKRQRNKNISLANFVNHLKSQSQQINESLEKIIMQSLSKPSEERLIAITQNEKFFNLIKNLKQRLGVLQSPSINCGWGEPTYQL